MNKNSAIIYRDHLKPFESFAMNAYNLDLDSLVRNIQEEKCNVYNILSEFTSYLKDHNYTKDKATKSNKEKQRSPN
jgi:hypothetical protein